MILLGIRKTQTEERKQEFDGTVYYVHDIDTKYYSTQIVLLPVDSPEKVPETAKASIEGIIIYFDSMDVSGLKTQEFTVEGPACRVY